MRARLLTGIDALASRDATSNPEPIIARVQAPAVLPNDVKANLSGCFVVGNATGSLAKERVEIQLVSLSCVDFDEHSVVDQAVKGFFVDTDGKKGLSGKVVTRAGAALARTVRRQNIWHTSRRKLAECGPRLGVDVKRRACGVASADIRWSFA